MSKIKALFITEEWGKSQINPFYIYKDDLEKKFNFYFNEKKIGVLDPSDKSGKLKEKLKAIRNSFNKDEYNLLFIQTLCDIDDELMLDFFKEVYDKRGDTKIIYLDWFDQAYVFHPCIFPSIDLLIKKQLFRDINLYKGESFKFKENLRYYIPYSKEPADYNKMIVGWNLITFNYLVNGFKEEHTLSNRKKIDINCRISTKGGNYYEFLRKYMLKKLKGMDYKWKIIATNQIIKKEDYLKELENSKICISPFGHGEVCLRDFEASLKGCLLIKPSMAHIITEPDIFIANETYVPVKWDLSDLKDKCTYYLENEGERNRIIRNARKVCIKYFKEKKFVDKIGEILKRLDLIDK